MPFFFIYFSFSPQPSDVLAQQGKGKEMSFLWRCDQRSFASEKGSVLNKLKLSVLFVCWFGATFGGLLVSHPINHSKLSYDSLNL